MSAIGGMPLRKGLGGNSGSVYGEKGGLGTNFALSDDVLDIFYALIEKIETEGLLKKLNAKDSLLIQGENSKSVLLAIGDQPFLLIRQNKKHANSFAFDPVAKTYFGRACDIFPALFNKVERETNFIHRAEERLKQNEGLVEKYVEANSVGLIMKATEVRRQAAAEYAGLVDAAERLELCVPAARQQLHQICALMAPREEAVAPKPQHTSVLGEVRVWLQRALKV